MSEVETYSPPVTTQSTCGCAGLFRFGQAAAKKGNCRGIGFKRSGATAVYSMT